MQQADESHESVAEMLHVAKMKSSTSTARDEMPSANSLAFLELRSLATSLSTQNQTLQQLAVDANRQL